MTEHDNSTPAHSPSTGGSTRDEPQGSAYKPLVEPLWNNPITMVGFFLVMIALLLGGSILLFMLVQPVSNPYVDIITYLIVPGILVVGAGMMPVGIFAKSWWMRRRDRSRKLSFRYPKIDLADPRQRRTAKIVVGGTFVMLPIVGVSSYHGYHFTDSTEFCAKACHSVMEPEGTTHAMSSHARVACAECHIGSGASWFVKAKLSGTRQVLAVWRKSYSIPIAPAIQHLRPARDTCEHCHWPAKFFGAQLRRLARFESDESNTRHEVDLLLKTGGVSDATTGLAEGIHWHTSMKDEIEYVATDRLLQVIPWLVWTDPAGKQFIYRSDGKPSSDPRPEGQLRKLDCMDCHNRPAHKFRSPSELIDAQLEVGRINADLPFIKRETLRVLSESYASTEEAKRDIAASLEAFYRSNYPDLYEKKTDGVMAAIDVVQDLYRNSVFPHMKVDWRTYPDNIGHKESTGCFRCHDGRHVNQYGDPIGHTCETCHTFLNPVEGGKGTGFRRGEFVHPFDAGVLHAEVRCQECHTGGPIDRSCDGCHTAQQMLYTGTLPELSSLGIGPNPMAGTVDCEGCHDTAEPLSLESIDALCMDCHEDEEEKYAGMLSGWVKDLAAQRQAAEAAVEKLTEEITRSDPERANTEAWSAAERLRSRLHDLTRANGVHHPEGAAALYQRIRDEAANNSKGL